jgi:hypothetical protein
MKALIKEWLTSRYPATCPHGRSICYRIEHKDIARKLDRHQIVPASACTHLRAMNTRRFRITERSEGAFLTYRSTHQTSSRDYSYYVNSDCHPLLRIAFVPKLYKLFSPAILPVDKLVSPFRFSAIHDASLAIDPHTLWVSVPVTGHYAYVRVVAQSLDFA